MARITNLCRRLHTAARRRLLAARIEWTNARIRWANEDADELEAALRQVPRQIAAWRGYAADKQRHLQVLVSRSEQL